MRCAKVLNQSECSKPEYIKFALEILFIGSAPGNVFGSILISHTLFHLQSKYYLPVEWSHCDRN